MSNKTEFIYKFQSYNQRQGQDIGGVRPVMFPADDGEWVPRHDIEHLVQQLKQAEKSNALLKEELSRYNHLIFRTTPSDHVMVPRDISVEQLRAIQLRTEIGCYVVANMSNAYDLFRELWHVAITDIGKD